MAPRAQVDPKHEPDQHARHTAQNQMHQQNPFSFCPSSAHCHAIRPVATTGTVKTAAASRLKYAAAVNVRFSSIARDSRIPRPR